MSDAIRGAWARRLPPSLRDAGGVLAELARTPGAFRAALLILPYAGVLIGLDVAAHYGALTNAPLPVQFFLASDEGFGEWLEYALTASVAVMLLLLWLRDREWAYLTNAALFAWLTADNGLQLHEASGRLLAPYLDSLGSLPIEPHHIGETVMFLAVGLIWLAGIWLSIRHARFRPLVYSLLLAACIVAGSFFGVVVDVIVVWGEHGPALLEIETFIEDGGEFAMIILAFLVTVAILDVERRRRAQSARVAVTSE